jgi:hypothetical protein
MINNNNIINQNFTLIISKISKLLTKICDQSSKENDDNDGKI